MPYTCFNSAQTNVEKCFGVALEKTTSQIKSCENIFLHKIQSRIFVFLTIELPIILLLVLVQLNLIALALVLNATLWTVRTFCQMNTTHVQRS